MAERIILHCDLNNFYASVECLRNPLIRDKPVAVCGSQELRHGVVLAKNYYAKACGVSTGEPVWQAKQKCPGLITVQPDMALYLQFSQRARKVYERYTDKVEAFGADECWLDVTGSENIFGNGSTIAEKIRQSIKKELGITVSIGVSFNKIFAKLGSDIKKPDAVTVISRDNYQQVVWPLAVEELLYVGRATKRKFRSIAVDTIGDLAKMDKGTLSKMLGKRGRVLHDFANGVDYSQVMHSDFRRTLKSVSNSTTTPRDLLNNEDVRVVLWTLAESVAKRLRKYKLSGKTVELSIRDNELHYLVRQKKMPDYTDTADAIKKGAYELFLNNWLWIRPIRSLGLAVSDLVNDEYQQISMLDNDAGRFAQLERCVDELRGKFGNGSLQRAIVQNSDLINAEQSEDYAINPFGKW